jgi:hypothetical protein
MSCFQLHIASDAARMGCMMLPALPQAMDARMITSITTAAT